MNIDLGDQVGADGSDDACSTLAIESLSHLYISTVINVCHIRQSACAGDGFLPLCLRIQSRRLR